MRVMFCNFNMFDINAQVVCAQENGDNYTLFTGTFEDVCEFMAGEYQNNLYDKIVLAGQYGPVLADRIRAYSIANYNFKNINIEVI